MNNDGTRIKHHKRRGEWAELRFMTRAAENGLCVSKPWGDSAQYDFAVEYGAGFVRVQVKSTEFRRPSGFMCTVRSSKGPYVGDAFDFVAAYIIPEDVWYIIPLMKILGKGSVKLYPSLEGAKYAPYKEAWDLLKGGTRIEQIEAYADTATIVW